jgi:cathepsin A (carboxypeptidase C)
MLVNKMFTADFMHSYHDLVPPMLEDGVQVLIYAGDVDYICNWLGNKAWTLDLGWSGKNDFNSADDIDYTLTAEYSSGGPAPGDKMGRLRSHKNFHFLQIYNAGHMVPMDQPEVASQMLEQFISGGFNTTTRSTTKPFLASRLNPMGEEVVDAEEYEGLGEELFGAEELYQ